MLFRHLLNLVLSVFGHDFELLFLDLSETIDDSITVCQKDNTAIALAGDRAYHSDADEQNYGTNEEN